MSVPSLRNVLPFPATEDYVFKFDVSGSSKQIVYNELEIRLSSDTSQIIYKKRIQEFRYEHTLIANTLINGSQYVAKIRIYDVNQNLLNESNPIFFYCFSLPQLTIPTIVNGEVANQTVVFEGIYNQNEGELLQSYIFLLYDENKILLKQSPEVFSDTISYEFSELENRKTYHIEIKIETVNGLVYSTGLMPFIPKYIAPRFNSVIQLQNLKNEASILVECNVIRIIGIADNEPVEYINGEKINLINNKVIFDEGFDIKNNFTIQLWVTNLIDNSTFFELIASDGSKICLHYKNNKIIMYKMLDDNYIMQILIGENSIIDINNIIFIDIRHIDGLYDFTYEEVVS